MNESILEQLESNLNKIETKEKNEKLQLARKIELDTEMLYCEIWKQILKNMLNKENFGISIILKKYVTVIMIDNKIKTIKRGLSLDIRNLSARLKEDGFNFAVNEYKNNKPYGFYVSRHALKEIIEINEKQNQKVNRRLYTN